MTGTPSLGAIIGAGVTVHDGARIAPGVVIGPHAVVRAGAVVESDVPPLAIVDGAPAGVVSYVHDRLIRPRPGNESPPDAGVDDESSDWTISLDGAFQERGSLVYAEVGKRLPFPVRRIMVVSEVPPGGHRGNHGHGVLEEVLICVRGTCSVFLDDGLGRREVIELTHSSVAAYVAPRVWTAQFGHSDDAVLVVLASNEYEPSDYYADYEAFLAMAVAHRDAKPRAGPPS